MFDIDYEDGDQQLGVELKWVRVKNSFKRQCKTDEIYVLGARVEVNYNGAGIWYSGIISRKYYAKNGKALFDITFDDKEQQHGVAIDLMREIDIEL